ncbi:hypothetical protein B1N41_17465 [Listeria monocytogenes]|nr:hypothetical protein [Listeria monocytogenes]
MIRVVETKLRFLSTPMLRNRSFEKKFSDTWIYSCLLSIFFPLLIKGGLTSRQPRAKMQKEIREDVAR